MDQYIETGVPLDKIEGVYSVQVFAEWTENGVRLSDQTPRFNAAISDVFSWTDEGSFTLLFDDRYKKTSSTGLDWWMGFTGYAGRVTLDLDKTSMPNLFLGGRFTESSGVRTPRVKSLEFLCSDGCNLIETEFIQNGYTFFEWFAPYKSFQTFSYPEVHVRWVFIKTWPNEDTVWPLPDKVPSKPREQWSLVGNGSSVVLDAENGVIVTNYHVVESGRYFTAEIAGSEVEMTLLNKDEANDLAVLKGKSSLQSLGATSASFSYSADLGEKVFALGYPRMTDMGTSLKITEGVISSHDYLNKTNGYQISCPITNGNSGGAIMNAKGQVVGVAQSGFRPDANTENVNGAIKAYTLIGLAQAEGVTLKTSPPTNFSFNTANKTVLPIRVYK